MTEFLRNEFASNLGGHTVEISLNRTSPHTNISFHYMSETVRTLTITEAEETALVEIIRYFNDMGLPDNVDSTDYDTLTDKVCEPAFWEYN